MIDKLQIYKDTYRLTDMNEINTKESRILELKSFLSSTDYHILKEVEGYEISSEILSQRASARVEINQLEKEVEELREQELQEFEELTQE